MNFENKKQKKAVRSASNDVEKPKKQRKAKTNDSASLDDLQQVEEFRHFLLKNDSQFVEYCNIPFVLSVFDSHLMRSNMISMMAQVLGNGQTKDNFFLQTRQAM